MIEWLRNTVGVESGGTLDLMDMLVAVVGMGRVLFLLEHGVLHC